MSRLSLLRRLYAPTRDPGAVLPLLPLAVFRLAGSQAEMGAQHGALQRAIGGHEPVLDYYARLTARLLRGSEAGWLDRQLPLLVRPAVRGARRWLSAKRPAELRARSAAFFRSLGLPAGHAQHLVAIDVLQNLVGVAGRHELGSFGPLVRASAPAGCSTLAAWGPATVDGRLLHARNLDFPGAGVWETRPTVVFCEPERGLRYGFVAARGADLPGVTAFNEAGLVVTTHTRIHQRVALSGASLVDLGHEIARRASTLQEAVQVASERPSAAGWGLLVSSASERRALLIELVPDQLEVVHPAAGEPWSASTNLYQAGPLQEGEVGLAPGWQIQAWGRLRGLRRAAQRALAGAPLDVGSLQTLLGSHEDPEVDGWTRAAGGVLAQSTSVQSVVVDADMRCLHLSVGRCPTGHGPYVRVPWCWDGAPGVHQLRADDPGAPPTETAPPAWDTPAFQRFLRAARLEALGANPRRTEEALLQATQLAPEDPTYRLLAGGVRLRQGAPVSALQDFEAALEQERSPFCVGRLRLWAARAAAAGGRQGLAAALRRDLEAMQHPLLGALQHAAATEVSRPLSRRRLRKVSLHVQLGDIG